MAGKSSQVLFGLFFAGSHIRQAVQLNCMLAELDACTKRKEGRSMQMSSIH